MLNEQSRKTLAMSSNRLLHDHMKAFLILAGSPSPGSTPANRQTPQDLRRAVRARLSAASDPMAAYEELKSSGALTRESCHAILFNPNLSDYHNIDKIATENYIPASYVVAKLTKLNSPLPAAIATWMRRVPPPKFLWNFIRELTHPQPHKHHRLEEVDNRNRSLAQCQMDLTAHMSYTIIKEGIQRAFQLWESWIKKPLPIPHRHVLKLPTLKLLHDAMQPPPTVYIIQEILSWQPALLLSVPKEEFRQKWVIKFLSDCIHKSPDCPYETAISVIELSEEYLRPEDTAMYSNLIIRRWYKDYNKSPSLVPDVELVGAFLSRMISRCERASFYMRAELERLKSFLENPSDYNEFRQWGLEGYANDGSEAIEV